MKPEIIYPIGGYAPGNYTNKCATCGNDFIGDKLARQCEVCAINTLNENYSRLFSKMIKIKNILINSDQ